MAVVAVLVSLLEDSSGDPFLSFFFLVVFIAIFFQRTSFILLYVGVLSLI